MVFTASENANTELERQWFEFDISVLSDQEMSNRINELNIMGFLGKGFVNQAGTKTLTILQDTGALCLVDVHRLQRSNTRMKLFGEICEIK